MKINIILTALAFFISTAVAATAGTVIINNTVIYDDCVKGNGKTTTQARDLKTFDAVELGGAFEVNIVSSKKQQHFEIIGEENIIPHIESRVIGNELKVYAAKNICPTTGLVVNIQVADIGKLTVLGSDDVNVSAINNKNFTIELTGTGDIVLAGSTETLKVAISGSGDVKARELKSKEAEVKVSGAGDVGLHASELLKVEINGAADVRYYGKPARVIKEINGAGDLEEM